MVGVSIKKIFFKNGTEIVLNEDDIVILVGPNNAGKSRTLKDIYSLISSSGNNVVVNDVGIEFHRVDEIKTNVLNMSLAVKRQDQSYEYHGYKYTIYQRKLSEFENSPKLDKGIRAFLVSEVKTEERLGTADPKDVVAKGQPKQFPLQYMTEKPILDAVSNVIFKIFNKHVYCYDKATNKLYLHIGQKIDFDQTGMSVDCISNTFYEKMRGLPILNEQGDGIRSLTGLLINIMMPNYSMFMIDEPEAFLHPPQAQTLGLNLPGLLKDKQAFIATHSIDMIKGLLTSAKDRVKIIRITRDGDINHIMLLSHDDISTLWNDSIIRHSNMLDCLFYEYTVLCESDSDCLFYSVVLEHLKEQTGSQPDALFIHCGGKGRMHLIIKELKLLGVNYRVIPDIDVFDNIGQIRKIFEASGGNWADIEPDYRILAHSMNQPDGAKSKDEFIKAIIAKINDRGYETITKAEANRVSKDVKTLLENKWDRLKKQGIDFLEEGETKNALERMISSMNALGIYPVKDGELESFIPDVGNHGPGWAMNAIEKYPNLDAAEYDKVKRFVKTWGI